MITLLRPLDMHLVLEDRSYRLGEMIDINVEITAKGDIRLREGRLEMVYQVRWTGSYTDMQPLTLRSGRQTLTAPTMMIPKRKRMENRESYVLRSVTFVKDKHMVQNTPEHFNFVLEIPNEPPPHSQEASVSFAEWSLNAAVDVARARNIKTKRVVTVAID